MIKMMVRLGAVCLGLLLLSGCVSGKKNIRSGKPWVGMRGHTITPSDVETLGIEVDEGVLIWVIGLGSPTDFAGINIGDVIINVDGQGMTTADQLEAYTKTLHPGDRMKITLWREGSGVRRGYLLVGSPKDVPTPDVRRGKAIPALGVIGEQVLSGFGMIEQRSEESGDGKRRELRGVLVLHVETEIMHLIRPDDVILSVNGEPIVKPTELITYLESHPELPAAKLLLLRRNSFVTVEIPVRQHTGA